MSAFADWQHSNPSRRSTVILATADSVVADRPLPDGLREAIAERLTHEPDNNVLVDVVWLVRQHPELLADKALGALIDAIAGHENNSITLLSEIDRYNQVRKMRDQIFVSYAHEDERFADELLAMLRPLVEHARIDKIWIDKNIPVGAKWRNEIEEALRQTRVAILLLSSDFLNSKFITETELPVICAAAERGELTIVPVMVRSCNFDVVSCIGERQFINPPDQPLALMPAAQREATWFKISQRLKTLYPGTP